MHSKSNDIQIMINSGMWTNYFKNSKRMTFSSHFWGLRQAHVCWYYKSDQLLSHLYFTGWSWSWYPFSTNQFWVHIVFAYKDFFFLSFWVISSASQRALSNYAIGFRFTLQIRPIMQGFPRGSTTCLTGQPVLPVQFLKKSQILT